MLLILRSFVRVGLLVQVITLALEALGTALLEILLPISLTQMKLLTSRNANVVFGHFGEQTALLRVHHRDCELLVTE